MFARQLWLYEVWNNMELYLNTPLTYQPWESFGASPSSRTWSPKCYRCLWGRLDILTFEVKFHILLTPFDPFFEDHKMMQWNGRSKSAKDIPSKKSRAINQLNVAFLRAIISWKTLEGFFVSIKFYKNSKLLVSLDQLFFEKAFRKFT